MKTVFFLWLILVGIVLRVVWERFGDLAAGLDVDKPYQ
jgi:hypothetical protein